MSLLSRGWHDCLVAGRKWLGGGAIHLRPAGQPRGRALLSYLTEPFLFPRKRFWHSSTWECRQIGRILLDLGLAVNVIDWHDQRFRPTKNYEILVNIGTNLPRLAPLVSDGCLKLMHATGKHWLYQNRAELQRLDELAQRRGVALLPRRIAPAGCGLEMCDACTVLGNEETLETLRYAGKPLYPIPLSPAAEFPWDQSKDFDRARPRFLWLGNGGMVLKGLDLVLEAFAGMPELELTVCGPVAAETDFAEFYQRELHETPNIRAVGWVNVTRPEFAAPRASRWP